MEQFEFITDKGRVVFGWGSPYPFSSAEGVCEGSVTRQTLSYPDMDGCDYGEMLYEPRIVTINGYIYAPSRRELPRLRAELTRMCNGKDKGTLKYFNGYRSYQAEAVGELPKFSAGTGAVLPFVCNFELFQFYWSSDRETIASAYQRVDKLRDTVQFPCVLTERVSAPAVLNQGDVQADMVILIRCSAVKEGEYSDTRLDIVNQDTGAHIALDYDIRQGETITIDTEACTVTSDLAGNMLHRMNETSDFFKLAPGHNLIKTVDYSTAKSVSVEIHYREKFVGV